MLFKRLEISGFKSFAKAVSLEFPSRISAIVGPNGSGKSNIADSIRWVLGEQSMKYLRGKRGEDLIFGGTSQTPRLAKASVSLVFDNLPDRQPDTKKIFPLDYSEVIISRRVYRDGVNDYLLNGTQVRLKDIIELLSKVGLGASQHHIIAQGDADRILYASPKERKIMLEEALGLKIFELKKNEAEKKLVATSENIKQVESLRREIQPHLKYLQAQVEKMKNASFLREELENITNEYVSRELKTIDAETREINSSQAPLETKIKHLESEIDLIKTSFSSDNEAKIFFEAQKKMDAEIDVLFQQRRNIDRKIGKLETESTRVSDKTTDLVAKDKVKEFLMNILPELESASRTGTMDIIRNSLFSITQKIYGFLETLNENKSTHIDLNHEVELKNTSKLLETLDMREKDLISARERLRSDYEQKAALIQTQGTTYRKRTEELVSAKDSLRQFITKKEKLEFIRKEFEIDFADSVIKTKMAGELISDQERAVFRKKIERLKIRLEEAGGVDEGVFTEHEDTKKRDEFLAKELDDLKNAEGQLGSLLEDLEIKIAKDFELGLGEINKLFNAFFHEIFSGGNAEIKFLKPKKTKKSDDELLEAEWEGESEEEGLDIIVNIPKKRIKSLNMLSGGERALTSIALLFAMSTVNPPPFLVLDETDAALDEANSHKYGLMLKELCKKTQLIVVTHNRETMKSADVLYGVTMGSDGVSKLLSMKFEEAENVLAKKSI